jgi:hypothetical protein
MLVPRPAAAAAAAGVGPSKYWRCDIIPGDSLRDLCYLHTNIGLDIGFNKQHSKSRCRLRIHSQMLGTTTGNRSLMYISTPPT